MQEVLDLCNKAVSKPPQIFYLHLSVEYVTSISGQTDAPEVRCGLDHGHHMLSLAFGGAPLHPVNSCFYNEALWKFVGF